MMINSHLFSPAPLLESVIPVEVVEQLASDQITAPTRPLTDEEIAQLMDQRGKTKSRFRF
jgi:hypothetical protein